MSERLKINEAMTVGRSQPTEQELSALAAVRFGAVVDLRQATESNQALPPPASARRSRTAACATCTVPIRPRPPAGADQAAAAC